MARNVSPAAIPREISSRSLELSTLGARLRCAGAIPPKACRTRYRFVVRWPSALAMPRTVSPALCRRARVLRVLSLEPLHPLQLRDAYPAVLRLPVEVGRTADPMLPGQLAECHSGF